MPLIINILKLQAPFTEGGTYYAIFCYNFLIFLKLFSVFSSQLVFPTSSHFSSYPILFLLISFSLVYIFFHLSSNFISNNLVNFSDGLVTRKGKSQNLFHLLFSTLISCAKSSVKYQAMLFECKEKNFLSA